MYIILGIILPFIFLIMILTRFRRRRIIRKICCMSLQEKLCQLNELIEPFGYRYLYRPDIFTTTLDAPQRDFGYGRLYDNNASRFNMIFDAEPIYFDYNRKTWMIEFWKGQYGINIGAEVGVYCADKIVPPERYRTTMFHSVSDNELLNINMELLEDGQTLFQNSGCHWWLTGFLMGCYTKPSRLTLKTAITFPDEEMLLAFSNSLQRIGYSEADMCITNLTLCFTFDTPRTCQPRCFHSIRSGIAQFKNRCFCRMYLWFTKPFIQTIDKMLYMKAYLPPSFNKMTTIKNNKNHRRR